jgi:hypothetical protein
VKIITGSPARNERFFKRELIRKQILGAVSNEENLLISAPRRVGKSSVLLDLVDNPDPNFYAVFQDTEAIKHPEQFYKLITQAILNADQIDGYGYFQVKTKTKLQEWASKIAGISIAGFGVEIEKSEKPSYYESLVSFLTDIKLEGKKILLLIDEFPITVENIQETHGIEAAQHFLSQNRALRQNPLFQQKIKFIYTGSIGLFTAVKKINATDRINDLREIKIPPLNSIEALQFLNSLMHEECGLQPEENATEYIIKKIGYCIPFYFQLLVRELSDLLNDGNELNEQTIDKAFNKVAENGNIYFEHFKSRLQKVFKNIDHLRFVNALMLKIKKDNTVSVNQLLNMANKAELRSELDDILEILKHDGYIVEEENQYRFYSPILKQWWK